MTWSSMGLTGMPAVTAALPKGAGEEKTDAAILVLLADALF